MLKMFHILHYTTLNTSNCNVIMNKLLGGIDNDHDSSEKQGKRR